jgi:hypothetical protein
MQHLKSEGLASASVSAGDSIFSACMTQELLRLSAAEGQLRGGADLACRAGHS